MSHLTSNEIRQVVRKHYGQIARTNSGCCSPQKGNGCCVEPAVTDFKTTSIAIGYTFEQLNGVPDKANLGLGCGNPSDIWKLRGGETVLDLGSGAGIDCLLAVKAVGPHGWVIGVDMTSEMIDMARENAAKTGYHNIEFRLGEIENLPVIDNTIDAIISNCVINLSPDKALVFQEAFRVLKKGGRLAIIDMVASGRIPAELQKDLENYSQCITGATPLAELEILLLEAGFRDIKIQPKAESRSFVKNWAPGTGIEDYILSATIEAVKP